MLTGHLANTSMVIKTIQSVQQQRNERAPHLNYHRVNVMQLHSVTSRNVNAVIELKVNKFLTKLF